MPHNEEFIDNVLWKWRFQFVLNDLKNPLCEFDSYNGKHKKAFTIFNNYKLEQNGILTKDRLYQIIDSQPEEIRKANLLEMEKSKSFRYDDSDDDDDDSDDDYATHAFITTMMLYPKFRPTPN